MVFQKMFTHIMRFILYPGGREHKENLSFPHPARTIRIPRIFIRLIALAKKPPQQIFISYAVPQLG